MRRLGLCTSEEWRKGRERLVQGAGGQVPVGDLWWRRYNSSPVPQVSSPANPGEGGVYRPRWSVGNRKRKPQETSGSGQRLV